MHLIEIYTKKREDFNLFLYEIVEVVQKKHRNVNENKKDLDNLFRLIDIVYS